MKFSRSCHQFKGCGLTQLALLAKLGAKLVQPLRESSVPSVRKYPEILAFAGHPAASRAAAGR